MRSLLVKTTERNPGPNGELRPLWGEQNPKIGAVQHLWPQPGHAREVYRGQISAVMVSENHARLPDTVRHVVYYSYAAVKSRGG